MGGSEERAEIPYILKMGPYPPDKDGAIAVYLARLGTISLSTAACATVVGDREESSGKYRLTLLTAYHGVPRTTEVEARQKAGGDRHWVMSAAVAEV